MTNQTRLPPKDINWTSYYHFISFPLGDLDSDLTIRAIWRRQYIEGPIENRWTSLELQYDYHKDELLIVECRKEWINGGSSCIRRSYIQPLKRALSKELNDGFPNPSRPTAARYTHSEINDKGSAKTYTRAETKWNGYCFNAQSFVDIVTEEVGIKLRIVSGSERSLMVPSENQLNDIVDGEEVFSPSHVSLWPGDDAP